MGVSTFGPLVTISATYGAGGSVIAPRLADALGLPFVDRLISADMSQKAARGAAADRGRPEPTRTPPAPGGVRSEEGLSEGEQAAAPAGRFLSYFARAWDVGALMTPDPDSVLIDDESIRQRTEEGVGGLMAGEPAVLLGRAGAVVLAARPRSFHVRLDGPVERRVSWAAALEHLDPDAVRRRQSEADRARTQFVKRVFHVDPGEPRLYHLMVDPTVLGIDATVGLLVNASEAFFAANPAG
jgi:cytidylate kinase